MPSSTMSASSRPMTGDEYIESIRDGREIRLYGDRVKDVTTHPVFGNSRADAICGQLIRREKITCED